MYDSSGAYETSASYEASREATLDNPTSSRSKTADSEIKPTAAPGAHLWPLLGAALTVFIVLVALCCLVVIIACLLWLRGLDWRGGWRRLPRRYNLNGDASLFDVADRVAGSDNDAVSIDSETTVVYDPKEAEEEDGKVSFKGSAQRIMAPAAAVKGKEIDKAEKKCEIVMGPAHPINGARIKVRTEDADVASRGASSCRRGGARTRSMGGGLRDDEDVFYDI